ncbi:MAG: hypothetical protein LBU48_01625, partial [Coriobacteriales bacterium]|nr:hypothetical protein [Coriobacteriales bacterium]
AAIHAMMFALPHAQFAVRLELPDILPALIAVCSKGRVRQWRQYGTLMSYMGRSDGILNCSGEVVWRI